MSWQPQPLPKRDLALSPLQAHLLTLIDGRRDVEALAGAAQLSVERVQGLLVQLVSMGLVEEEPEVDTAPMDLGDQDDPPTQRTVIDPQALGVETGPTGLVELLETWALELSGLAVAARVEGATGADEEGLWLWCVDTAPDVVRAVLSNAAASAAHARLVAFRHLTVEGLSVLVANEPFMRDEQVRERLLNNPALTGELYARGWAEAPLSEQYTVCISAGLQHLRVAALATLRAALKRAPPLTFADFLVETQGAALGLLDGLDPATAAILANRPLDGAFLENLALWPHTPPTLRSALAQSEAATRTPRLKALFTARS